MKGKTITNTFTATASAGMVYFWSDAGNCNDVTAVSITKVITTTTTVTTTTTTTTTTASSTTNTIDQAIAKLPKLSDIEALIEEQIQKLTTNSEALANRVSLLENENADLKASQYIHCAPHQHFLVLVGPLSIPPHLSLTVCTPTLMTPLIATGQVGVHPEQAR